ncbi:MAG: hypothetical protein HYY17_12140 [Planctomycetes bacterium]|nr:hypothetical protein [Planctomycetota bacterium]
MIQNTKAARPGFLLSAFYWVIFVLLISPLTDSLSRVNLSALPFHRWITWIAASAIVGLVWLRPRRG